MIQLRPHQERGVAAMQKHSKGQIIVPTGGGKTLKMIYDALREFQSETPQTIVVVAPRILLAEQLSKFHLILNGLLVIRLEFTTMKLFLRSIILLKSLLMTLIPFNFSVSLELLLARWDIMILVL